MMDNNLTNKKITGACCGRPFPKTKPCGCNYYSGCLTEYPNTMLGCIKKDADPCKAKAVIPSITTEAVDGITNLANCFVHVTNTNTTFYVDDKHRPMIIWAGAVEIDLPSDVTEDNFNDFILENRLGLKSQHVLYKIVNEETSANFIIDVYYDKTGKPFNFGTHEEIGELV